VLEDIATKDVTLFINIAGTAPHAYRNLEGNVEFEQNIVSLCWGHEEILDEFYVYYIKKQLEQRFPDHTIYSESLCSNNLIQYDGVIFQKNLFLKQKSLQAEDIIKAFSNKSLILNQTISHDKYRQYLIKRDIVSAQIEQDILNGIRTGYGALVIKNDSHVACLIISEKEKAHETIVSRGEIQSEYQLIKGRKLSSIDIVSVNNAFKQTQQNTCGLVYGGHMSLEKIYPALKNIDIAYQTLHIWISNKDVDSTYENIVSTEKDTIEKEEKRKAELRRQQVLEQEKRKAADADRLEREATLREIYGQKVKGFVEGFSVEVIDYPQYVSWLDERQREGWEGDKQEFIINDYGTVDWNERTLEGVVVNMMLRIKNRALGEYEDYCFSFTKAQDSEFSMRREMIVAECDDIEVIERWKTGLSFKSLWHAK